MTMPKQLFYINLTDEQIAALKSVVGNLAIELRKIKARDEHHSVGSIIGVQGFSEKPKEDLPESAGSMILFSQFSDSDLDAFLAAYRETGAAPIPCKAVITLHNLNWSLTRLYAEIAREAYR